MKAEAFIISGPSCPSRSPSSCGEIPRNQVSGERSLGGADKSREAAFNASRDTVCLLAPELEGWEDPACVVLGWIDITNSMTLWIPRGRSGRWASSWTRWDFNHGSTRSDRTRVLRIGRRAGVGVLRMGISTCHEARQVTCKPCEKLKEGRSVKKSATLW